METFLNIIPIIVPTIVVVGVMVFVSYIPMNILFSFGFYLPACLL